jgi:hypothetical protein
MRRKTDALIAALLLVLVVVVPLRVVASAVPVAHGVLSDDNPYPEVNPCASGVSGITDAIKVCTLMREEGVVRVYTEPRRAMVWIQISETGPTAHVSDTVNGVAVLGNLTARNDWHVSIQTWNLPPGVSLESQLVYLNVRPGMARTFTFVCASPPCNLAAPTSTPTMTSSPPNWTPTPSATVPVTTTPVFTPTASPTPTVSAPSPSATITSTAVVTPSDTATPTPHDTSTPEDPPTPTPEDTATPSPDDTATPTAPGTASPTATPTPSETPAPSVTPASSPTVSPTATASVAATTSVAPSPTSEGDRASRVFVPFASRGRR